MTSDLIYRMGCTHLASDCLLRLPTSNPPLEDTDNSWGDDVLNSTVLNYAAQTETILEPVLDKISRIMTHPRPRLRKK